MTGRIRLASVSVLAIGTLALGGCGKSDKIEAKNESVESVAEKVAKSDIRPSAGRWESSMKIVKLDLPGMPAEMKGAMEGQLGKVNTSVSCLTKEDTEKSDEDFFKPPEASGCKYNSFSMGDGKIDADMTCKDENGSQDMKMSGTYGADAYAMKVNSDGNMGGQQMSMEMQIESKRVGDCDGSEKG